MAPEMDRAEPRTSRIGKRPIPLPAGVTATMQEGRVEVRGPQGTLTRELPAKVTVGLEDGTLRVSSKAPGRSAARLQGLVRALIANMVRGVTEGYQKQLELHGAGYRVELKGQSLHFSLGFSHPVEFPLPESIVATIPADSKGTMLIIQGTDRELVGQVCATIRGFRPAEPYSGKGVRYRGERIREKAGKAGK